MLRAQGTAINIKRKNAGFRWLLAYGNLHFAFSFTAPLLYRNIATAIAQIIPYPAKLHLSGICPKAKKPSIVENIICE